MPVNRSALHCRPYINRVVGLVVVKPNVQCSSCEIMPQRRKENFHRESGFCRMLAPNASVSVVLNDSVHVRPAAFCRTLRSEPRSKLL